jgi:hypothetical protein
MTREDGDEHAAEAGGRTGSGAPIDTRPGSGSLSRVEARRDETTRRWGVVTPAATRIGRADSPENDLPERLRRLHDEQHVATEGHAERAHHLDKLRITQALCNAADLTPWQRDRVLGVMERLDLTEFGSQRAVPTVALVAIRHVVDVEVRRYLGLEDEAYTAALTEAELEELFEQYRALEPTADEAFRRLTERHDLDTTSLNRLRRTLREQLDDEGEAVFGRNPHRDPNLPSVEP